MDLLTQKISEYLQEYPNSDARSICKEVGADKKAVNSCLYSSDGTYFLKEGLTPPLWRNIGDFSKAESAEAEAVLLDDIEAEEELDFEIEDGAEASDEDEDWTRLNAEDQHVYLKLCASIARGEFLVRSDGSRMNRMKNQIEQSKRSEKSFVERQEHKAKNKANYAAMVNQTVNEMWNADEQRTYAIEALTLQFESNLRKLAYGHLISCKEKLFEHENESDIKIRHAKGYGHIISVSSTIETRLSNLEDLSNEDLISSTVRFGWFNRDRTSRPNSKSATEMFPQFEKNGEVKIYRSRFQGIVQRIKSA